jgi:hypothetical protein
MSGFKQQWYDVIEHFLCRKIYFINDRSVTISICWSLLSMLVLLNQSTSLDKWYKFEYIVSSGCMSCGSSAGKCWCEVSLGNVKNCSANSDALRFLNSDFIRRCKWELACENSWVDCRESRVWHGELVWLGNHWKRYMRTVHCRRYTYQSWP